VRRAWRSKSLTETLSQGHIFLYEKRVSTTARGRKKTEVTNPAKFMMIKGEVREVNSKKASHIKKKGWGG